MLPKAALLLALSPVLLTGCASSEPPLVVTKIQVERVTPPMGLLACLSDPEPPVTESQAVVASYLVNLWEAWADCSGKIDALRRLYATPDAAVK